MPVQPAVRVEGLGNLTRALRKIDGQVGPSIKGASLDAAKVVARTAETSAPRRSGRLARSIRPGASLRGAVIRAGSYANPIHWGWPARNIAPNPFLTRAIDQRRSEVVRIFSAGLSRVLNRF